jgi:cell division protein FtsW (lipid II flippase)
MRPTLFYSVLRIGLFAIAFLLLYLAGARSWLLLGLAALISAVVSYFVLSAQRNAMAGVVNRRLTTFRHRLDAGTRAEDDD